MCGEQTGDPKEQDSCEALFIASCRCIPIIFQTLTFAATLCGCREVEILHGSEVLDWDTFDSFDFFDSFFSSLLRVCGGVTGDFLTFDRKVMVVSAFSPLVSCETWGTCSGEIGAISTTRAGVSRWSSWICSFSGTFSASPSMERAYVCSLWAVYCSNKLFDSFLFGEITVLLWAQEL